MIDDGDKERAREGKTCNSSTLAKTKVHEDEVSGVYIVCIV